MDVTFLLRRRCLQVDYMIANGVLNGSLDERREVIVVGAHAFVADCLACWLSKFGWDLQVTAVGDLEALPQATLDNSKATILFEKWGDTAGLWLERQITCVRARRPDLSIAVFGEPSEALCALVMRHELQGFIPASATGQIAAAALLLVMAGASYFPRELAFEPISRERPNLNGDNGGSDALLAIDKEASNAPSTLTPRERAVLSLLEQGLQNKIIAYRLGMSQSTVKAHVHHIIAKLRVRNRTEAAVSRLQSARPE